MENGAFKLKGQPYRLKSVNFRVEVVAREVPAGTPASPAVPRVALDGKPHDVFLAAYGSYSPDNNSWCRDPPEWNPQLRCCSDAASCAAGLEKDVQQLQAMGVNSVRLLMDTFKIRDGVPTFGIGRIPYPWRDTYFDLRDPAQRDAAMAMQKRAVQFLGARGVRSLMLLNGTPYMSAKPELNALFRTFVSQLSATMKDEPFLIGFDFDNEPTWASGAPQGVPFDIDKNGARELVRTWVDAVRSGGGNSRALLTIGNAFALASIGTWDPAFLPLDFNSSHIYPPGKIGWGNSRAFVERETFYAALGACGVPCQVNHKFDSANCVVREAPVGTTGKVEDDGSFTYKGRLDTCPAANRKGDKCWSGSYERGRDEPFVMHWTHYYVKARNGQCPPGAPYDGANCHYGTSKPASYPAGWEPFQLNQPMFYVKAIKCENGRKPLVVGEYGASVHDYNPTTGAIAAQSHGDAQNQATYLREAGQRARDCGYQGVQWWQHGDVHWGNPEQDHYGLWADYRQVFPGKPVPEPDAMVMRPAGAELKALDLLNGRRECPKPSDWSSPLFGPGVSGSKFRYLGKVFDQHAKAVPFALLTGRLSGGGDVFFTFFADHKGNYDIKTPRLVEKIRATHFGHHTTRWHVPVPLAPTLIKLEKAAPQQLPAHSPPHRDEQACRQVVF